VRYDLEAATSTVIANTEIAYFSCRQAEQVLDAYRYALEQAEKHLAQAKAFYTIGRRPQFDVSRAEVDLANAQVGLIRARNQIDIAQAQLDNALGVRSRTPYALTDSLAIPSIPLSLDSLKAIALHERPELLAARSRLEAGRSLAAAARSQHYPTLSASGAYTWNGFDFPLYSRWNAALTLSVPLFQGFAINGQVRQAEANAIAAEASLDATTDGILLETEQAFLSLTEADSRLRATDKLVQQAEENALLAERQYAAGTGTPLDASDAQLLLLNARTARIQATFDFNTSFVRLQRALGTIGGNK
jgi:outer membrane protein TolC